MPQERDVVVLPRKPDHASDARRAKLTIQRTLEFSSQTLRSGVVAVSDDSPARTALLFIRGAPGLIKELVQPSSVPENFEQVQPEIHDVHAIPRSQVQGVADVHSCMPVNASGRCMRTACLSCKSTCMSQQVLVHYPTSTACSPTKGKVCLGSIQLMPMLECFAGTG